MNSKGLPAWLLVLILSLLVLSPGNLHAAANKLKLSKALAVCQAIDVDDPTNANDWLLEKNLAPDLSDSERKLLSEYRTPGGRKIYLERIITYTRIYMSKHGSYPENAIEAFTSAGLMPVMNDTEFSALSEMEQLEYCEAAVNPLTGDLHQSFDNEEWVPFGILLKPIRGSAGIKMMPRPVAGTNPTSPEMSMQPMRTWLIRVYGELPGKVLLEGEIWTDANDPQDLWWKEPT
ncbi:MAG: hypothetical protein R3F46_10075 [bacterium]